MSEEKIIGLLSLLRAGRAAIMEHAPFPGASYVRATARKRSVTSQRGTTQKRYGVHSKARELARQQRQIAKGMLKVNGARHDRT